MSEIALKSIPTQIKTAPASARILVLSSGDQWRRCLPFAKISTRIDPLTSTLDQGHIRPQSRETNKAVLTKGTRAKALFQRGSIRVINMLQIPTVDDQLSVKHPALSEPMERAMMRSRKKFDAAFKAKIALEALRVTRRFRSR